MKPGPPLGLWARLFMIGAAVLLFLESPWVNAAGLMLGSAHIFYQVSGSRAAVASPALSGESAGELASESATESEI